MTGRANGVEGVVSGSNSVKSDVPVHAMGHISDTRRLSLVYAASDVFVSPSREDSGPVTVAESMLSGTPVVAFPVGNAPELVRHEDTGYIARYEDVADFAAGLAWAIAAPRSGAAVERGLRCHLAARAHNDPEIAVARHLAVYEDMLGRAAGGSLC